MAVRYRHARRAPFTKRRHSRRLHAWLTARVAALENTGALVAFTASADGVAASATLTLTGNAQDTETVTIDGKVYTFQTSLTDVDGNVLIGATASDSIDNLVAAITLDTGAGVLYADSTTEHPTCTAAVGEGDTMTVSALVPGARGTELNFPVINIAETMDNGSFGGLTSLAGGVDPEQITKSAHGLQQGDGPLALSNSGGALPDGLTDTERYWVQRYGVGRLFFCDSRANAAKSVHVSFDDDGTGTHSYFRAAEAQSDIFEWLKRSTALELETVEDIDDLTEAR